MRKSEGQKIPEKEIAKQKVTELFEEVDFLSEGQEGATEKT